MKRAVTYSVVEKKDPKLPDMPGKFYAQAQARGTANIRELSERIQQECTVTRADVMAVLTAFEHVIAESLANGEIVRLGDLGSFQISLSSQGAETKEKFTSSLITKRRILFRGGKTLSNTLATLDFEKVLPYKEKQSEEVTEPEAESELP